MLLIFSMKIRRDVAGFSSWIFGNNSKCTSKTLIEITPFQNQTLKLNSLKPHELMPIACFNCQCLKIKLLQEQRIVSRQALRGA